MQWFGYTGKILEVDLTERKLKKRDMEEDEAQKFMGGAGLNAWTLYNSCKPGTSALGPDNPLIFGVGPLVGTEYPSAARSTFTSLSAPSREYSAIPMAVDSSEPRSNNPVSTKS